jgi:hypothetical protein
MPTRRKLVRYRKALNVLKRRVYQSGGTRFPTECVGFEEPLCALCHNEDPWPSWPYLVSGPRPPFKSLVDHDGRELIYAHHYRTLFLGATAIRTKRFLRHTLGTNINHMLRSWETR